MSPLILRNNPYILRGGEKSFSQSQPAVEEKQTIAINSVIDAGLRLSQIKILEVTIAEMQFLPSNHFTRNDRKRYKNNMK